MQAGAASIEFAKIIPGIKNIHEEHLANTAIVIIIILLFAYFATKNLRKKKYSLIPSDKLTFQNIGELIVEAFINMLEGPIGHEGIKFLPLIGTLGIFILFSNLSGLIPGMLPPTDNINTTAGCALIVFFTTHIIGFRKHGIKYLKHFMGPFWWLAPLMAPIEIISHFARPLSLSLRLFGNIMGDHLIFTIFVGLVPFLVPIPILVLGMFVSFVQMLVFVLLSIVYFAGAVAEEH